MMLQIVHCDVLVPEALEEAKAIIDSSIPLAQ